MSQILFSSSFDDKNTPLNILTNKKGQFWASTGLYPQEIIVDLGSAKRLNSISLSGYNIKKILIESCENESTVTYNKEIETECQQKEGDLQQLNFPFNAGNTIKLLKIVVLEGYDSFCAINTLETR